MRRKHNWEKLKQEYILSQYHTLSPFFREKKLTRNQYKNRTKGWMKEQRRYRDSIAAEVRKRDKEQKVLSSASQAKMMSEMMEGAIVLWRRLFNRLTRFENRIDEREVMGKEISIETVESLRRDLDRMMRTMPDISQALELVAGRATARPEVRDKNKRELEQLQKQYDEKRARLEALAKDGSLKIVRHKRREAAAG